MADLMATGSDLVDAWVKHASDTNATTPELMAMLLIQLETQPNKLATLAILAATAVQRVVALEHLEGDR
jgi:hypothetical protein